MSHPALRPLTTVAISKAPGHTPRLGPSPFEGQNGLTRPIGYCPFASSEQASPPAFALAPSIASLPRPPAPHQSP